MRTSAASRPGKRTTISTAATIRRATRANLHSSVIGNSSNRSSGASPLIGAIWRNRGVRAASTSAALACTGHAVPAAPQRSGMHLAEAIPYRTLIDDVPRAAWRSAMGESGNMLEEPTLFILGAGSKEDPRKGRSGATAGNRSYLRRSGCAR
jgi:hypothetical protein